MAETPQPGPWHRIVRLKEELPPPQAFFLLLLQAPTRIRRIQALDYRSLRYVEVRLDRFRVSFQNA